jgi:S1-C subfamily serine protease
MESSQFSYEAPGSSYESPNEGEPNQPPEGAPKARPLPQSVPSVSPLPDHPASLPPPPPPAPSGPFPVAGAPSAVAYPNPAGYPPYAPQLGYPAYPGYIGGYGPPGSITGYPFPYQSAPAHRLVRHTLRRRTWLWVVVVTAVLAALVGGLVGAVVGSGSQQTFVEKFFPNTSALAKPQDIQEVLAKVEPAVVSIDSRSGASSSSLGGDFVVAAGSGMILTPDGEILTNNHVVAGATSLTVTLFGQTNALPAHVVGTDPSDDLALVQIDHASSLPAVTFGDSSQTRVGDTVLAIGNALALAGGPTVTEGIVSAENRSLTAENDSGQTENLTGLLQTDAAINPGNSGGPLVNAQAQVVGMNTAVASSSTGNAPTQNVGFAITVDSVKPLLAQLRQGGTGGAGVTTPHLNPAANSAYIGVTVGPVTPALQQQDHLTPSSGALIISVEPGSPAQKSALQVNDVIVSLNGTTIQSPDELTTAIHPLKPGDRANVGIYRGGTRINVGVTLGARPSGG